MLTRKNVAFEPVFVFFKQNFYEITLINWTLVTSPVIKAIFENTNFLSLLAFVNQILQYKMITKSTRITWKLHGSHADLRLHLRQFATLFQTWEKRVNRTQYTLWKPHLWGFEFRLGENSEKKKEIIYFLLTSASNVN